MERASRSSSCYRSCSSTSSFDFQFQNGGDPKKKFGLGLGRYGNETPSPIDAESQLQVCNIQLELDFIRQLPEHIRVGLGHTEKLLDSERTRLERTMNPDWLEVDINKPIKLSKKVLVPVIRHPDYNYVGRILGPNGTILSKLADNFKCKMNLLGKNSTKDRANEEALLQSGKPCFAHYDRPLHLLVEVVAPADVAFARMAGCLRVLRRMLSPGKFAIDTELEAINSAIAQMDLHGSREPSVGGAGGSRVGSSLSMSEHNHHHQRTFESRPLEPRPLEPRPLSSYSHNSYPSPVCFYNSSLTNTNIPHPSSSSLASAAVGQRPQRQKRRDGAAPAANGDNAGSGTASGGEGGSGRPFSYRQRENGSGSSKRNGPQQQKK